MLHRGFKEALMKQRSLVVGIIGFLLISAVSVPWLVAQALVAQAQLPQQTSPGFGPLTQLEVQHDTSRPLRELVQELPAQPDRPLSPAQIDRVNKLLPAKAIDPKLIAELIAQGKDPLTYFQQTDPVIQSVNYPTALPALQNNFEGQSFTIAFPPDPVGDIGYDPNTGRRYYVQWVNLSYAIWDVTGTPEIKYTAAGNSLWSGFGGPCANRNDGDPIVLFDQLAGRWLLSQFALPNYPSGPFYQCIAISQTADPTGAYQRYAFQVSATKLNDYPHFGVWPDGYYMTVNQFNQNSLSWGGAGVFVFERDKMLQGQVARMVYFDLMPVNSALGGMLPADLEGLTPPPLGAPNLFAEVDNNSISELGSTDALRLWKFHVDWQNTANSTFGVNGQPDFVVPVAPFNWLPCVLAGTRNCIPQPGAAPFVDAVGDRLMHRLTYRNFGDHDLLLMNHTVDAGSSRAGIRWYEVRNPRSAPVIYQQGTYAPNDSTSRWMGSLAMDHTGNIALGYSVSSLSVYPSIRYAGRLVDDPPGEMTQGEDSIVVGGGSQTDAAARWGDYSSMNLDPIDDCTFWYTQEYYPVTSARNWYTRIASFRFPNCSVGPRGGLQGAVRAATSTQPITNARILIAADNQPVIPANAQYGLYTLTVPVNTYTLTASAYGYTPGIVGGVSVIENLTTTQDVLLNLSATYVVSGYVTGHASTPLYATMTITGTPFNPPVNAVSTDPATGFYSVTLAADQAYSLTASSPLHAPQVIGIATLNANRTENFALTPTTDVNGGIIGWVRNLTTQQGVVSATVSITPGVMVTTDANGYFEALNLLPGSYTIKAEAYLYDPVTYTNVSVQASLVAVRTFDLAAPHLEYRPPGLEHTLIFGEAALDDAALVLSNTGQLPLGFVLSEVPEAIWFDPQPLTGTVPMSSLQNIQLGWYGDNLDQPGVYTTTLHLQTDDPLATDVPIPVTFTLQPTVTQGLLTGVVSTTGSCDINLAPIAGAQLHLVGSGSFSQVITTNESGLYRYWLDQTYSPYTVTLTAHDHLTTTTVASITGGLTTTQNYTLRLQQPCVAIAPATLSANLKSGQSTTRQLVVTNTGAVPLNATIYEVFSSTLGGLDAAGYTWRHAPYNWIDATDGTPLNLADDGSANIMLPFEFPFYGVTSSELRVSNNGAVLFDALTGEVSYLNQPLIAAPDNFIAPFWDDLDSVMGNVYWKTIGAAPNRRVVIEWRDRPHHSGTPGTVTFELVLSENGNLAFQYQNVAFGDSLYDNGQSATVGVRGVSLKQVLQVSYNAPTLANQQALCFTRPGNPPCDAVDNDWLSVAPISIVDLAGSPSMTQPITVTLLAAPHLGGGVTGTLRLVDGNPFQPDATVSVILKVTYQAFLPVIRR
jgi:hypothetical protein